MCNVSDNSDGIYEPGSEVWVRELTWCNTGGLTAPAGVLCNFPSNATCISGNQVAAFPSVTRGSSVTTTPDTLFKLRLPLVNPSENKPHISQATFSPLLSLIGRVFEQPPLTTTVTVQYPIQVVRVERTTFLGPNERSIIKVTLKNISNGLYGHKVCICII